MRADAPRFSRSVLPVVVLVVGLVATFLSSYFTHVNALGKDQTRFENEVQDVRERIRRRLDTYIALLRAGAGLFAGSHDGVTREEFRAFVERLDLGRWYPGIQGIGFCLRVPAAEREKLVETARAEGVRGFKVWPDYPRDYYYPIVYLEPMDHRNQRAVGYDMFSEPVRREAMLRAARMAVASASGKVRLVQEIEPDVQPGFLIYVPIYSSGMAPADEGERLNALRGFVYSPYRARAFLGSILQNGQHPLLSLRVYDGINPEDSSLLFATTEPQVSGTPRFRTVTTIDVEGRTWLLVFTSRQVFEQTSEGRLVPLIAAVGTAISLLLFIASMVESRARAEAETAASDLRRSEEMLRASEAELMRLVDAERQAHAEATAANRAKDDFLATLSHELRTPLNSILGWASMLQAGQVAPEQQAHALAVIARNARAQADLIEDLLDVSRIITGKLRIELRPVTMESAVRSALDSVRPAAEAKGLALEWHPSTDGPVLGDPDRLQQVVWNLLTNAIKFTPPGGRVAVSLEQRGPEVELRVADTGIGLTPEFLPSLFVRFRQRDSSTKRQYGGMGLGLAIVRHLVEAHGGTVRAESEGENRGATFIVTLPVRMLAVREAGSVTGSAAPQPSPRQNLGPLRVLLVDDDPDARELLARALEGAGADARTAGSVEGAMAALQGEQFDVLVADIGMPGLDGYDLIRQVRSHRDALVRGMPAVAVTAYARPEDRDAALAAGFQVHLAKPIDLDALVEAIRDVAGV